MHPSSSLTLLRLHLIVFLFGFSGVLGRLISLESVSLVWYRMGLAFMALLLYAFIKNKRALYWQPRAWGIMASGAVIALHWVAFFWSIKASNVTVGLTTVATAAFFGSLLEPLFYRRSIITYEVLLGIMVTLGMVLIFRVSPQFTEGIIAGLIAAFLGAIFSILNGHWAQRFSSLHITVYEIGGGFAVLGCYFLFAHGKWLPPVLPTTGDWPYLLVLGLLGTAFTFIESVGIMRSVSPYTFLLTLNLEPIYGTILAVLLFGEDEIMSGWFYSGAALILLALVLNSYLQKRRKSLA